ncbi:MAG: tRNA pseudouridine(38-40) synthase TruA [Gammaproteobacteria bacterium]|nr:tRNA pseudouridine(38-40) synthase TruA [Gammaproteobacteria bacterium]
MPRVALGVEYDGTDFFGWQTQRDQRSVQSTLTAAVGKVAAEAATVHGAGRTDTGVHALRQVVHFDTRAVRTPRQWVLGINSNLPDDVRVHWARDVAEDFDARRSAIARRYRYLILNADVASALLRRRVWWLRDRLDCAAMTRAAQALLGENDFSAFRAAGCQSRTPMRRLDSVGVSRHGTLVALEFVANAFLHHMVRNLVGVLAEVGAGRAPPGWAADLLAGRDRTAAGVTAPAAGLTLVDVEYPERFGLPAASAPDFPALAVPPRGAGAGEAFGR